MFRPADSMGSRRARWTSDRCTEARACRSAPPPEGADLIVDRVAHAGGQPGAGEGELAAFPERMLHDGGNLARFRGLVVVHLVESERQAGAFLGEQVGQQFDLVA